MPAIARKASTLPLLGNNAVIEPVNSTPVQGPRFALAGLPDHIFPREENDKSIPYPYPTRYPKVRLIPALPVIICCCRRHQPYESLGVRWPLDGLQPPISWREVKCRVVGQPVLQNWLSATPKHLGGGERRLRPVAEQVFASLGNALFPTNHIHFGLKYLVSRNHRKSFFVGR